MEVATVTDWIARDAAEMALLLREGHPEQPVTACPGWTAADLSHHIARGFAWYCYNISTPPPGWSPDGLLARFAVIGDDYLANVATLESGVAEFIAFCSEQDLTSPTWVFGDIAPARWWVRRAAVELTVHLTDAAGMHGRTSSTPPAHHSEAVDELMTEMFPRIGSVLAVMSSLTGADVVAPTIPDRPAALVTTDTDRAWTLVRGDDGAARPTAGIADDVAAVGRGTSADVLAWLHGRPLAAPLMIDGDASLLDDWNLYQRAPL